MIEDTAERGIPPEKVAKAIAHALESSRPRTRYLVGLDAKVQARLQAADPDPRLRPHRRPAAEPLSRSSAPQSRVIYCGVPIDWSINAEGEPEAVRAAAVQLNSNGDKARNLAAAERLVRAAAADGAEFVALPEKWNLLAGGEELVAGAEPLDGPSLTAARGWAREPRHPPARRQHLRARRRGREGLQHLGPDRPRRRGPRRLPQDPHVRRRRRRRLLPRVRARAARRRSSSPPRSASSSPGSPSVTTCASRSCSASSPCAAPG